MATNKNDKLSNNQKVGIGVGIGAAVAAAAGAYFLYGSPKAAKNRKTVKSWALKAKAEVLENLEKAQAMSQAEYEQLINTVTTAYGQMKDISKTDLASFKKEMKDHWTSIAKTAVAKKPAAKKAVKKAVKAVAKKAPAKK